MGGICTKMLASNESLTSKTIHKNDFVTTLPGDKNSDEGKIINSDKKGLDATSDRQQDYFSKGDYRRDDELSKKKSEKTDNANLTMSLGDQNLILQTDSFYQEETAKEVDSNESNGHATVDGKRVLFNLDKNSVQKVPKEKLYTMTVNDLEKEAESNSATEKESTEQKDDSPVDNGGSGDEKKESPDKKEDSEESKKQEAAAAEAVEKKQRFDSLYFFPLEENRPVTPSRIPDRLLKERKQTVMSYNERMLLADLNRFEQLDKRRQFAVRQNRSIPRNGKLPRLGETESTAVTPLPPESPNGLARQDD